MGERRRADTPAPREHTWADQPVDARRAAMLAWAALPPDSRVLLRALVVDRQTVAQLAARLRIAPDSVAGRAAQARQQLALALVRQHHATGPTSDCRTVRGHLGLYLAGTITEPARAQVDLHAAQCPGCRAALAQVGDLDRTIRTIIWPSVSSTRPVQLGAGGSVEAAPAIALGVAGLAAATALAFFAMSGHHSSRGGGDEGGRPLGQVSPPSPSGSSIVRATAASTSHPKRPTSGASSAGPTEFGAPFILSPSPASTAASAPTPTRPRSAPPTVRHPAPSPTPAPPTSAAPTPSPSLSSATSDSTSPTSPSPTTTSSSP